MLGKISILATFLLVGCIPQNATLVSGEWKAFLNDTTSFTIRKDVLSMDDYEDYYAVDCRDFSNASESLRLDEALDVCGMGTWPPEHEIWLNQGAYHVLGGPLEPWRGEAIMTSEGGLQITFHHRLNMAQDFRFSFVLDPEFQPKQCEQSPNGDGTMEVELDGDWIEGWSTDLETLADADELPPNLEQYRSHYEGGALYYLNSGAYQFNPSNTEEYWSFPREWRAGYAAGKFAEELIHARPPRYGDPNIYSLIESEEALNPTREQLWYCDMDAGADASADQCGDLANGNNVADEIETEMSVVEHEYRPLVHGNEWRVPDGSPDGVDGWTEMHYNWVILDEGFTAEEGGGGSGVFSLVFDGDESSSRVFVSGEFFIEEITQDIWVAEDLHAIKMLENETQLCGSAGTP